MRGEHQIVAETYVQVSLNLTREEFALLHAAALAGQYVLQPGHGKPQALAHLINQMEEVRVDLRKAMLDRVDHRVERIAPGRNYPFLNEDPK